MPALDAEMATVDTGEGDPVVFLHGNPTSSYLWRTVMPHVETMARCLAPDLLGMGESGKSPSGSYRFVDHARYLDAWFEVLELTKRVTLAFHWAFRHQSRVRGIARMEAIVRPLAWDEWPERSRALFQSMRSPAGEDIILEKNVFVERILPASVMRGLGAADMEVYRRLYLEVGESRRPTLTRPRQIPLDGEPADAVAIVDDYAGWLGVSDVP